MTKQPVPNGQKGRDKFRYQVTLDRETIERLEKLMRHRPEIESLSAAIRYASRVAVLYLPKEEGYIPPPAKPRRVRD